MHNVVINILMILHPFARLYLRINVNSPSGELEIHNTPTAYNYENR